MADRALLRCNEHGESEGTYVCQHLHEGGRRYALGFFEANCDPDTDAPKGLGDTRMAWCKACDVLLKLEGDWTERSTEIANPTALCTRCFEQILRVQMQLNPVDVVLNDNDI